MFTLSLRGQILTGRVYGTDRNAFVSDPSDYQIGMWKYFEGRFFEVTFSGLVNLSHLLNIKSETGKRYYYAVVGYGMTNWRQELRDLKTDEVIRHFGGIGDHVHTSGQVHKDQHKDTSEHLILFGLGITHRISSKFDFNVEMTLRNVLCDKLDGLEVGPTMDRFVYSNIGFSYKFDNR